MPEENNKTISLANLSAFKAKCDAAYVRAGGEDVQEISGLKRFTNGEGIAGNTDEQDLAGTDTKYKSYSIEGNYAGDSPFVLKIPHNYMNATLAVDKGSYPDMTAGKVAHKLTIVSGGVTVEYDGSEAKTVTVSGSAAAANVQALSASPAVAQTMSIEGGFPVEVSSAFMAEGSGFAVMADGSVEALSAKQFAGVAEIFICRLGSTPYTLTGGVKVQSIECGGVTHDIVKVTGESVLDI